MSSGAAVGAGGAVRVARRIDIKVYPAKQYAYALLYFTGCGHFNRSMRYKAKTHYKWSLSDKGCVRAMYAKANGKGAKLTETSSNGSSNRII